MNGLGDLVIDTRALTKRYGDSIVAVDDLDPFAPRVPAAVTAACGSAPGPALLR